MINRLLTSLALLVLSTAAHAQVSESDFSIRSLSTNLEQPMAMEVDPDGDIFIIGRCGRFYVWSSNTESVRQTSTIEARCDLELGLIGITLDPDYENNRWVYLHYNPDGESTQRVSRFEMNANKSLNMRSEIVMLEFDVQTAQCCHQGGDLEFAPDGLLYISVGDNVNPFQSGRFTPIDERPGRSPFDAQGTSGNTNDLRGAILRIRPLANGRYSIPDGNLFEGDSQHRPEIYVMGNRNPFRMTIDEQTGYLYWGEIGPDSNSPNANRGPAGYDEINQARSAGNYGWPYVSGFNEAYNDYNFDTERSGARFNVNAPRNDSPNNTGAQVLPPAQPAWLRYPHAAMMAGVVYHYDNSLNTAASQQRLPRSFDGQLIFWNFNNGDIYTVEMDRNGNNPNASVFFDNLVRNRGLIDMTLDNDDRLLVLGYDRNFNGQLSRIEFGGDQGTINRNPTVVAEVTPAMGSLPLRVGFSAVGTTDPDGDRLTYTWDFTTDGTVDANGQTATHVYNVAGQYNAQLRVTDSAGNSVVRNFNILAGVSAPQVTLSSPSNGSFFEFGDMINWQVSVQDASEPNVDCSDITVELALGHVTGDTEHEHGLIAAQGCSGTFQTDSDSGHEGESVFLALIASYTNSDDITANAVLELQTRRREAEHWTQESGVDPEVTTDSGGGFAAAFINDGDWVMYRDMNLINVDDISVRVASERQGGTIQARVGGVTGRVIGSVQVENTGGWQEWETLTMAIDPAARNLGSNDLYFTFSGTDIFLFNVNWFNFNGDGPADNPVPVNPAPTPVAPQSGPTSVTQRIEAENFVGQSGIQTQPTTDAGGGQNIGFINAGDSVTYSLNVPASGTYELAFRVASERTGGTITLNRGSDVLARVTAPATEGWQNWVTVETTVELTAGTNLYNLQFAGDDLFLMNINWFEFSAIGGTPVNTTPATSPGGQTQRIQAESFVTQSGIQTQVTTDAGGGENISFINAGDSATYSLNVPSSGTYEVAFRVASARTGGTISLARGGNVLARVNAPATGDWQNWVTVETTAELAAGTNLYNLEFSGTDLFLFNVNWFEISPSSGAPASSPPVVENEVPDNGAGNGSGNDTGNGAGNDTGNDSRRPRILIFTETRGFRHGSISDAVAALEELAASAGMDSDNAPQSAGVFTDANLANYDAVVWASTTGDVLNGAEQAAFERYIRAGGGYVGVHAASDTEHDWPWYGQLVGAYFERHPATQQATQFVEDNSHPSTTHLGSRWTRTDEWYDYNSNPRSRVNVLLTLDEDSYNGGGMGRDHPSAWYHEFQGGRSWYTGGGHTSGSYAEDDFRAHLLGGLRYATGVATATP